MNTRYTRNSIITICILFIAVVLFAIFRQPQSNNQDIIDYLESTLVTAQAHSQWIDDYTKLTGIYGELIQTEKVAKLNGLLGQMEEIQVDVEQSAPPAVMERIKSRWNNECELVLQAVYYIILGFENNKPEWSAEAYEFLLDADKLRQEWTDELAELMEKNAIAAPDFVYKTYFG